MLCASHKCTLVILKMTVKGFEGQGSTCEGQAVQRTTGAASEISTATINHHFLNTYYVHRGE